jgi:antitoxin FitA
LFELISTSALLGALPSPHPAELNQRSVDIASAVQLGVSVWTENLGTLACAHASNAVRSTLLERSELFVGELLECFRPDSITTVQINIRDVPEKVRDGLAARAALQGKSMQELLRAELKRLAGRPLIDTWLRQVRARKRAAQTRVSSRQILDGRHADRR